MQLILLQNVQNLGKLGDKVDVKPGYGRNFLVPQGKATPATAANLAEFEARRAEYEAKAKATLADAEARQASLSEVSITIRANAATDGKLYGSITPRDIAVVLTKAGHPGDPSHRRVRHRDPPARRHRDHRQGDRRGRSGLSSSDR